MQDTHLPTTDHQSPEKLTDAASKPAPSCVRLEEQMVSVSYSAGRRGITPIMVRAALALGESRQK